MYIRKITEGSGIPNNAVLDGYSTSQTDTYSCNYSNKFFGHVIWTNPNPNSSFANQDITVEDMSEYKYIEIFYKKSGNESYTDSNKILKGYSGNIYYIDDAFVLFIRNVNYINNTSLSFDTAKFWGGTGSFPATNDNNRCVPIYIVGYKEF